MHLHISDPSLSWSDDSILKLCQKSRTSIIIWKHIVDKIEFDLNLESYMFMIDQSQKT